MLNQGLKSCTLAASVGKTTGTSRAQSRADRSPRNVFFGLVEISEQDNGIHQEGLLGSK